MLLQGFIFNIIYLIDQVLVPLIFSIGFIVFLWGVFRFFIAGASDEKKREEGKKFMLYGLIGFFVMFSIWGIVNVFINTLGFNQAPRPELPLFGPTYGGGFVGQGNVGGPPVQGAGTCGNFMNACFPWNHCENGFCVSGSWITN